MSKTNTKTLLTVKTDKTLKDDAKKTAAAIGIPLSTAINAFLKQFVREQAITLSANNTTPTPYLERVLSEAEKEYVRGESSGPLTGGELLDHLGKL